MGSVSCEDEIGGSMSQNEHDGADGLFLLAYEELRALARRLMVGERPGHTLQATAIVNELYLTLSQQTRARWKGKTHFKAVAAFAMRRLLAEHARTSGRKKRGGGWKRVTLHEGAAEAAWGPDVEISALLDALQGLTELRERTARVVEMKFFAGLDDQEIAEQLGVSSRTVERDWRFARAWLLTELGES